MTLDNHRTPILAILVLFLGRRVNRRIPWLCEYAIPEPVTGGLIASTVRTVGVSYDQERSPRRDAYCRGHHDRDHQEFGASPRSFLVVPLVGAFFVDIANAIILQTLVKVLGG